MADLHKVSSLGKTWIFDLDGTVVKHNGYKLDGEDSLLDGAPEFLSAIPNEDKIVFLTSRTEEYREMTIAFLESHNIRYDGIMFGMPMGERILVNDAKPKGLKTAIAINTTRDEFMKDKFVVDDDL